MTVEQIARALADEVAELKISSPVAYTYNPLAYAWEAHAAYLQRFAGPPKEVVLVGMNPGPWGMAQTGVPFGEVESVRDWMGIRGRVEPPAVEHPKRRVTGFETTRREVSGRRLWSWARTVFGSPQRFFERFFVANYCPLLFLDEGGRNLTPDRLSAADREPLFAACDRAIRSTVEWLQPQLVVGVGGFAAERVALALAGLEIRLGKVLHPSPASPAANRGWSEQATRQLRSLGVELPGQPSPERRGRATGPPAIHSDP